MYSSSSTDQWAGTATGQKQLHLARACGLVVPKLVTMLPPTAALAPHHAAPVLETAIILMRHAPTVVLLSRYLARCTFHTYRVRAFCVLCRARGAPAYILTTPNTYTARRGALCCTRDDYMDAARAVQCIVEWVASCWGAMLFAHYGLWCCANRQQRTAGMDAATCITAAQAPTQQWGMACHDDLCWYDGAGGAERVVCHCVLGVPKKTPP